MICSSCNNTIIDTSKFCPHCGDVVFIKTAPHATAELKSSPEHITKQITLRLKPEESCLPYRYAIQLASGTDPEDIIRNLLKHKDQMRILLERIVENCPDLSSRWIDAGKHYLQSHCTACGEQTKLFKEGESPICSQCKQ
jgi:rRNA maturation protein Nop10